MSKGFELDANKLRAALSAASEKLGAEEFEALAYMFREQDRLIEDSQEVYEETGLTPRQLAEQRAELLDQLKIAAALLHGIPRALGYDHDARGFDAVIARIANATQQRNATGGEG